MDGPNRVGKLTSIQYMLATMIGDENTPADVTEKLQDAYDSLEDAQRVQEQLIEAAS